MDVLSVQNISKQYGAKNDPFWALRCVDFQVKKGTITGIVGKSGAGKSTLLRCLNGIETPSAGHVFFEGTSLDTLGPQALGAMRQKMGMIFQSFHLLRRRTALENVALPLEMAGYDGARTRARAIECLSLVGLEDKQNAYPGELSGGQAQRVAIARALACDPHVLLCDEATSALDPETTQEILSLLGHLNHTLGLTLVLITHEMAIVRDLCTHVVVLHEGMVVEKGPVPTVFSNPTHPVTTSLVQHLFNARVPRVLMARLSVAPNATTSQMALRLFFSGASAQEPVISDLMRQEKITLNIAGGALDPLGESICGTLVVTIPHEENSLARVTAYLEARRIQVTLLGYLS
jgi:D-methionine transport system ATP-binding protein